MKETDTHWTESRCPRSAGRNPNPGDSGLYLEQSDECCAVCWWHLCVHLSLHEEEEVAGEGVQGDTGNQSLESWAAPGMGDCWSRVSGDEGMTGVWVCGGYRVTGINARARRVLEGSHWIWVIRRVLGYSDDTGAEAWGIMVTGGVVLGRCWSAEWRQISITGTEF